jgi:hypothetical protein
MLFGNASSTINDDATAVHDLHNIVIKDLMAASLVCPSIDSSEYFDSIFNREISEGMNDQGKLTVC